MTDEVLVRAQALAESEEPTAEMIAASAAEAAEPVFVALGASEELTGGAGAMYLREIANHDLLTYEDEKLLATRMKNAREADLKLGAGELQDDVHAVGVALKLNDGTGPYAFNCGAPAFRFAEDRLRNDIGPRLVAMVRNIEAALGGTAPQSKKEPSKKAKSGGKVARVAEGIRQS